VPDVVLPVLNEASTLGWVLGRMPPGYRPIVVDNGSSDGSADVARSRGATVIEEPRRGYGSACYAGLLAASHPVVAFLDADGSLDPVDLPAVCDPVAGDALDLVLAARRPGTRGAWPLHARLANRALGRVVGRRTGNRLRDLGPMRAASRDGLIGLGLVDRRSGWPLEMILRAADAGWRIGEVPIRFGPRRGGRPKETGTVGGTVRAVRDMSAVLLADGRARRSARRNHDPSAMMGS
jgi:glycosyltransferase involved in cell wall biosynthesis